MVYCNLQLLTVLNAVFNDLTGTIPPQLGDIGGMLGLFLNNNRLKGTIPDNIYTLRSLQQLLLGDNDLTGTISSAIEGMDTLRQLSLSGNLLTGTIPENITELILLQNLNLQSNKLHGSIPYQLSKMHSLKTLNLGFNRLSGSIAYSTGLLNSSATSVSLNNNRLTGPIPHSFCDMLFLTTLNLQSNHLSNTIPSCFSDLSYLTMLALSNNRLSGPVPSNMSSIYLTDFLLNKNHLTGSLPTILRVAQGNLKYFEANGNQLSGSIPASFFTDNVQLQEFSVQTNHISGSLSSGISLLDTLSYLDLSQNVLSGSIASGVGQLSQLGVILLGQNIFTGEINFFNSTVQTALTNIGLSNNQFTGALPVEPFYIPTLQSFAAVSNCLFGSLPVDICQASQLTALALDGMNTASSCQMLLFPEVPGLDTIYGLNYHITGEIPSCLFNMTSIQSLHLSGNGLRGSLSPSLTITPTLVNLSLSYNQLTGSVPRAIEAYEFLNLDLSFNKISGRLHGVSEDNAVPVNGSVKLQVNRLSGNIPKLFRYVPDIAMLNGNQFQCAAVSSDCFYNLVNPSDPVESSYDYQSCQSFTTGK
eukprot:gene33349-41151_t